jgi:hypothetical protein
LPRLGPHSLTPLAASFVLYEQGRDGGPVAMQERQESKDLKRAWLQCSLNQVVEGKVRRQRVACWLTLTVQRLCSGKRKWVWPGNQPLVVESREEANGHWAHHCGWSFGWTR